MVKINKYAIFLIIIALLFALIVGGKLPYIIFYIISIPMLISLISSYSIFKKLSGYQELKKRDYYTGDLIEIRSIIDNDTILPAPLIEVRDKSSFINDTSGKPSILFLKPFGGYTLITSYKSKYRGIYRPGPIEISISDLFGLCGLTRMIYTNNSFKIYPRIYNLEYFELKSMQSYGTVSTKQRAYEDNTSVSDIRKYNIGDNLKRIHWKVSARKGDFYVKNFEMTGSAETYIFMDLKKGIYKGINQRDLEEVAVETASSLIAYFLGKGISVNLYINSSKLSFEKGRDIKDMIKFLNLLCESKNDSDYSINDVVEKRIRLISKGATLIIVTGDITLSHIGIYSGIRKMGYEIIIICVSDMEFDDEIKASIITSLLRVYFINSKSDIRKVLESK